MLKILLILGAVFFLMACGKTVLTKKGDRYIWLEGHSSYPNTKPYWKKNELEFKAYFGKYTYFSDHFNDYYGDPLGPIAGIWSVTRYLGREPNFKDCGEKPIWNPDKHRSNTPEYKDAEKKWDSESEKRRKCIDENNILKVQKKTITYYYARSPNNYLPLLPKRPDNHGVYEINVSFGPMGGLLSSEGLSEEHKSMINQLDSEPCHRYGKDTKCYRLPGEDSHLYYTVRSVLNNDQEEKGKVSPQWKRLKRIRSEVHKWEEIKGIEITQEQYEYMQARCKDVFNCYLDENTPNLSAEQKAYIKATAWDIDTDMDARRAFVKKADGYLAH